MLTSAPPPLPTATSIDDVIDALDAVIDWSIRTSNRMGYFAALYKRITAAVGEAVDDGAFEDASRMERLDVVFASRYLEAVNGYFHPGRYPKPTRSWRVTFDAAGRPDPIIVQHMLAGVNTHIDLDLGIAAEAIAPGRQLPALHEDFNRINAVLASQVNGVVDDINELSPALADIYAVLQQHQIFVINEAVRGFRDSAWRFASLLALTPRFAHPPAIWARDFRISRQAQLVYDPPGLVGVLDRAVREIAARESRDVVENIRVLNDIASTPAPIRTAL